MHNVTTGLPIDADLSRRIEAVFGSPSDPMPDLEERANVHLPGLDVIVWEGDATTFEFGFVSRSAEQILGYPTTRWTNEPTFWADTVVHPDDKGEAVAYCALATGQGRDHDFQYRAIAQDGRVHLLHDIVRVVLGSKGVAERLRGIMIDLGSDA